MFIDTHAHLTSREFDADREDVISRATDAGVTAIVNPSTDLADSRRAVELAQRTGGVYACVGVHPHEAAHADEDVLAGVEDLCTQRKVVAIGEIGLDFHYDFAPHDVQEQVFRAQLGIAARKNLPVVIHMRDATEETVRIVRETVEQFPGWRSQPANAPGRFPAPRGVFHCFPGDTARAWELIALGFAVSLPGIVTFKNAGNAVSVARDVSIEHLLLETDSPYLAPVPHRGTRNEPSHLPLIASKIAELQRLSVVDIARAT
jgi:TatD DNase family protein